MENKIKRFIELSKEFIVNGKEIYKNLSGNPYEGNISINTNSSAMGGCCSTQTVSKTQLETFEENATKMVEKAKRFEEYLTLQTDLSNYYNALTKLK